MAETATITKAVWNDKAAATYLFIHSAEPGRLLRSEPCNDLAQQTFCAALGNVTYSEASAYKRYKDFLSDKKFGIKDVENFYNSTLQNPNVERYCPVGLMVSAAINIAFERAGGLRLGDYLRDEFSDKEKGPVIRFTNDKVALNSLGYMLECGTVIVTKAGHKAGDSMTGGNLIIGTAQNYLGTGMKKGTIIAKSAADFAGAYMEGGEIFVSEGVGNNAGFLAMDGTMVIFTGAGLNLGSNNIIKHKVYISGYYDMTTAGINVWTDVSKAVPEVPYIKRKGLTWQASKPPHYRY